jgi:hypothetical protein
MSLISLLIIWTAYKNIVSLRTPDKKKGLLMRKIKIVEGEIKN